MTHDTLMELKGEAHSALEGGEFMTAAQRYTSAAYLHLALSDVAGLSRIAPGLVLLLRAALSYRLAADRRATLRAKAGALLLEEVAEYHADSPVERGLVLEYTGDFHLVGGLDGEGDYYEQATAEYEDYEATADVGERIGQLAEPEFHENTALLRELLAAADVTVAGDRAAEVEFRSPTARAEFKATRLADVVAMVVERGAGLERSHVNESNPDI